MPEFKATVYHIQSREVTVRAHGHKSAAAKAIKAAEDVEPDAQEVEGVDVQSEDETGAEGRYYQRIAGELEETW